MTTYKGIQGTAVQNFAGDPDTPIIGQVWYNSLSGTFRYNEAAPQLGAWQTGGNLNTARSKLSWSRNSNICVSFWWTSASQYCYWCILNLIMEQAWTEVNDLNTARTGLGGAGTQTAALGFGGLAPATGFINDETESWNGTSWTEVK
jgi:hypothetical protein